MPTLKIGDEQNAILLIQQSQTDPQKAVAELVENSIDARAKHITISRFRKDGHMSLIVSDDGEGVPASPEGEPDFEHLATHICDSLKRNLDPKSREGVQGQYAIGILGFASVGEELILRSKREGSRTRSIRLHASRPDYEIDREEKHLRSPGTEAEIRRVKAAAKNRLAPEKLHRYLSEELRDRIRKSGVRIIINDRIGSRKSLVVKPREYSGTPIASGQKELVTTRGLLKLDLYAVFPREGARACVAIARNGTRLLEDMLQCEELHHEPWDLNLLEGVIDFGGLTPSPATRRGFIPDGAYEEFVTQLKSLEPGIRREIEELRKRREQQLEKELLEKLQRAFVEAMDELPDEYSWFEKPGSGIRAAGPRPGQPGGKPKPVRLSTGPLAEVRIVPKIAVIGPDESRVLVAKAFDPTGALIPSGVSCEWSTTSTLISLKPVMNALTIEARGREGEALVRLIARLKGAESRAESKVLITKYPNRFGFPPPDLQHAPMESWRSKYSAERGIIEINSGHRDYERANAGGLKSRLRYIAKLYAKELVLLNFASVSSSQLLEYMIEVTGVLESKL